MPKRSVPIGKKKGREKMEMDILGKIQELAKKTIEESKEKSLKIENKDISQSEIELAQKLDAIQEFSVDRLEDDIVVLENRKSGKTINVEREELPEAIKEGDILKRINGKYSLDNQKTIAEEKRIQDKMKDLWK